MKKNIVTYVILFFSLICCQSNSNQVSELIFIQEIPPSFPGGEQKLKSFIRSKQSYLDSSQLKSLEGEVNVEFTVSKTGSLSDISSFGSKDTALNKEAIRIVKLMPRWNPAKNSKGDSGEVNVILSIIFDLDKDSIYNGGKVDVRPEYSGGEDEMWKFLSSKIRYPNNVKEEWISGNVYCKFVVEKSGKLTNIEIVRSPHPDLSEQVLKAVEQMPKWKPGTNKGKAVRTSFIIPVQFRL